jgi:hypothetical protein
MDVLPAAVHAQTAILRNQEMPLTEVLHCFRLILWSQRILQYSTAAVLAVLQAGLTLHMLS